MRSSLAQIAWCLRPSKGAASSWGGIRPERRYEVPALMETRLYVWSVPSAYLVLALRSSARRTSAFPEEAGLLFGLSRNACSYAASASS